MSDRIEKKALFEAVVENLTCSTITKNKFFQAIYLNICEEKKLKSDIKYLYETI